MQFCDRCKEGPDDGYCAACQPIAQAQDHAAGLDHECGPLCPIEPASVKRPDLFGNVNDTYQTEAELNGWRQKQGSLL